MARIIGEIIYHKTAHKINEDIAHLKYHLFTMPPISKKVNVILLSCISVIIFLFLFFARFGYPYPLHIDEWHHVDQALKIRDGSYDFSYDSYRLGFHLFLAGISYIVPLVDNYQYFAAIWGVISALTLWWVLRKLTNNDWIPLFAMVFFASLKANSNMLGIWYFVPLTFSIPFLFLYIYYFIQWIEKQSFMNYFVTSLLALFLIFIYPLCVTFSAPILLCYALFNWKKIGIKHIYSGLSIIFVVGLSGLLYFININSGSFSNLTTLLVNEFIFEKGWGVYEVFIYPHEIYSWVGLFTAIIGLFYLLFNRKHLIFSIWLFVCLIMIILFFMFEVSILSPYQRNVYFLALVLPIISAFGLWHIIECIDRGKISTHLKRGIQYLIVFIALSGTFISYYVVEPDKDVYFVASSDLLTEIKVLQNYPNGIVMSSHQLGNAIYAMSGQTPFVSTYFVNSYNKKFVEQFFSTDCDSKNVIIKKHNIDYVVSSFALQCNYDLISSNNLYIYSVNKN